MKVKIVVEFRSDFPLKEVKTRVEESLQHFKGYVAPGTYSQIATVLITEDVPAKLYEGTFNSNSAELS